MNKRILIIDDDYRHCNLLANYFETHGFDTLMAANATEMKKQRERFRCDLLVLDINLPGEDGLSICQRLRAEGDRIPILFLTGRDHVFDRIIGLEQGADDYLAKPFEPLELVARVKAILRRTPVDSLKAQAIKAEKVQFGPYLLDMASDKLWCDGHVLPISLPEFNILRMLAMNPGEPKSRNQLANHIKGDDQQADERYIDLLVSRLRKRLNDDSVSPQYIHTVRNLGYVLKNATPIQLAS